MIKINLVSEGRRPVVSRKTKERLGIAGLSLGEGLFLLVALLGGLAIFGYYWYLRGQVRERAERIEVAQKEVDALAEVLKEVEEFKRKKENFQHKIAVIEDLKRRQRGPVRIMDQISSALPELMWLDGMQLVGNNVELRGQAFNTNQIATFIENLGKTPEFQEPRLGEASKNGPVYSFVISFTFNIAEPKPPAEGAPGAAAPGAAAPGAGTT